MKKNGLLLLVFLTMQIGAFSQTEFKYYTFDWKECSSLEARFAAVIIQTDSGWVRKDYFLPKQNLQMQGLYKDRDTRIKNGTFHYFHSNGRLLSKGKYVDDKKEGLWLSYHPNGYMSDSISYNDGHPTGISIKWHNNGYTSDSTNQDSDPAVRVTWHSNGVVSGAGRLDKAGRNTGKWQYFHNNGKLSAQEVYEDGQLTDWKYFAEDGTPIGDSADKNHEAGFPGGVAAWQKFLAKNLYWPPGYELVNGDLAAIGVEFRIDENGDIHDIFLYTPFADVFNNIVIRTIQKSPKWKPQLSHNRRVSSLFRQTVNFSQEER